MLDHYQAAFFSGLKVCTILEGLLSLRLQILLNTNYPKPEECPKEIDVLVIEFQRCRRNSKSL